MKNKEISEKEHIIKETIQLTSARYFSQGLGFVTAIALRRFLGPFYMGLWSLFRIISDYPSTGFFESGAAKMPTLSLYKDGHLLWDGAREFFGPMLQSFTDAKEAMGHIDNFLASDKKKYVTELPLVQSDIADLFHRMKASDMEK